MSYLRLVASPPLSVPVANPCLDAYEKEFDYIFETLRRLGATHGEIEDLAQEIFVVLHRNWPTLDTSRPLRPYLFGIAFRIVSAHRRRRAREILRSDADRQDSGASPEGLLQVKESVELLAIALDRVPLPRRAVLVMHDLDGIDVAEIAERLSISRFGVYARLRKARKELAAAVRRLWKQGVQR
jgi:RNA polymerase sigma-70 factor (ECF subfamily)